MPQGLIQLNVSRPGVFYLISPCPLLAARALAFALARARNPKRARTPAFVARLAAHLLIFPTLLVHETARAAIQFQFYSSDVNIIKQRRNNTTEELLL